MCCVGELKREVRASQGYLVMEQTIDRLARTCHASKKADISCKVRKPKVLNVSNGGLPGWWQREESVRHAAAALSKQHLGPRLLTPVKLH